MAQASLQCARGVLHMNDELTKVELLFAPLDPRDVILEATGDWNVNDFWQVGRVELLNALLK